MRKERGTQQAGEGEESEKRRGSGVEGLNINSYPALPTGGCVRKKGITRCREAWECVAAAARPGRGCSAVSRAAAAGLSPGRRRCAFGRVSRDRQRRPLHSHPRAPRPRGDLHWPISVAGRPGLAPAPLRSKLLWGQVGNRRRRARVDAALGACVANSRRGTARGGNPEPQTQPRRCPGTG